MSNIKKFDNKKYTKEFISEARDHLDALNNSLLELEKNPSDEDSINTIFRAFHTLKGNAAVMGYIKFSDLAHSLEDLLSKVRDKEITINTKISDILFEGCDLLEQGLDLISKDTPEELQNENIVHEIKSLLSTKTQEEFETIKEKADFTKDEFDKIEDYKKHNNVIFRLIIHFDKNNPVKSGKALIIMRDLTHIGEIIKTTPTKENIKSGNFISEIELIVATKEKQKKLIDHINNVSGVKDIIVLNLDDKYTKTQEKIHEEKEIAKQEIIGEHQAEFVKQIQSIKVDMNRLDHLMNLVGELLINNIRLQDIDKKKEYQILKTIINGIDRLTIDLQDEVMQIRMVPIGNIFKRFPRMVRDLANKENKKINFIIEGEEIEFDRTILDEIGDPLVHLLRNCVDHGIEIPDDRINIGKPQEGTVKLIAKREKNNAVIIVTDDGGGIDPKKVKESSIQKGIITPEEADKLTDLELQMLIFKPGVSTNKIVTEVSGRGVGMDVVISKIRQLGGLVKLESTLNKGTTIKMLLPLTLAIITALIIKVSEKTYVIPLSSINQAVNIKRSNIKTIQGINIFVLRNKEIPIFWLSELLGEKNIEKKEKLTVVIVNRNGKPIGLVVDSIISQQQVLIKNLQDIVKGTKGVSGATILGDGSVSMILDIETLFN